MSAGVAFDHALLLRMHATEAESEGLATFGGGIGSMLPMQQPFPQHIAVCSWTSSTPG